MLAFITNLSGGEILVIAIIAVLIFGRNLPEVAGRVYAQLRKVRRAVDEMRRETGIDRDMRELRHNFRDIEQEAKVVDPLRQGTKTPSRDFVHHLEGGTETDPATHGGEAPTDTPAVPPLGQPMEEAESPPAAAEEVSPETVDVDEVEPRPGRTRDPSYPSDES